MFKCCEICGSNSWVSVYEGAVRNGTFGKLRSGGVVARCSNCLADRLSESLCLSESAYEDESYRAHLLQDLDTTSFFVAHDEMQIFSLKALWPMPLRGLTIADVGCAGGSFLDHVRGIAGRIIAVEPCSLYHQSLARRGYEVYGYADHAAGGTGSAVDLAVSFQVIEHTLNPLSFLSDIRRMVKPGGYLLLSTPNRRDFLLNALPDCYPQFFYRVAHRWYFDEASLANCVVRAGFTVETVSHAHRYTLSNALLWFRDKCPSGRAEIAGLSGLGDDMWRTFLERTGQADCLFMLCRNSIADD